jgi:hypothetical protein
MQAGGSRRSKECRTEEVGAAVQFVDEQAKKYLEKNSKMSLITETEEYANLEWKLYELRREYAKRLSGEYRTLVHREICSEN